MSLLTELMELSTSITGYGFFFVKTKLTSDSLIGTKLLGDSGAGAFL